MMKQGLSAGGTSERFWVIDHKGLVTKASEQHGSHVVTACSRSLLLYLVHHHSLCCGRVRMLSFPIVCVAAHQTLPHHEDHVLQLTELTHVVRDLKCMNFVRGSCPA